MTQAFKLRFQTLILFITLLVGSPFLFAESQPRGTIYRVSKAPHSAGPNCWNAALVAQGVLPFLRNSSEAEFLYLLENTCHELSKPKKFALGRIYMPYVKKELHGFTYLNSNTVYAKNSDQVSESYVVMTFDAMMDYYHTSRECKISAIDSQDCFTKIQYYKCSTLPNSLNEQMQSFHAVEKLMNRLIFSEQTKYQYKDDCKSLSYQKRNEILYEMKDEIEKLKVTTISDLAYAKIWVDVMISQLFESEVSARQYRCRKQIKSNEKFQYYNQTKYAFKDLANILKSQSSN